MAQDLNINDLELGPSVCLVIFPVSSLLSAGSHGEETKIVTAPS